MPETEDNPLIAFLCGEGPDTQGRLLADVWGWTTARLEVTHDYIQWLFPLTEASQFNPFAPVAHAAALASARQDRRVRENMRRSLAVMLAFYGLGFSPDGKAVEPADDFEARAQDWITRANHNFLRLTRILKSLRLFGLEPEATAVFRALATIYRDRPDAIGPRSFAYWQDAAKNAP